jgi:hypothetical protein
MYDINVNKKEESPLNKVTQQVIIGVKNVKRRNKIALSNLSQRTNDLRNVRLKVQKKTESNRQSQKKEETRKSSTNNRCQLKQNNKERTK